MILNKIEDPRDSLSRARRSELVPFARAKGLTNVTEAMPAVLIRRELRAAGFTRIAVPHRPLGAQNQTPLPAGVTEGSKIAEVDADADLARQFAAQSAPIKAVADMAINELRAACKERGIKLSRRDNMQSMREKLGG